MNVSHMEKLLTDLERPQTRTMEPICTGTSVIGVVFDEGIAIAADTLASYGKMARFKKSSRLYPVNDTTLIGIGGDYADYQFLRTVIENKVSEMKCVDFTYKLSPLALHSWLTVVLYNRRSNFNPLWNNYIVGGLIGPDKKPYLGTVNKLGVAYQNPFITTGLGAFIVQHLLEQEHLKALKESQNKSISRARAISLLEKCVEILFERDCVAHNEFEIGLITAKGVEIVKPKPVVGNWETAKLVCGYE